MSEVKYALYGVFVLIITWGAIPKNIAPLQNLLPVGRVLYAKAKDGTVVVVFPADHLLWTERVADIATWLVESEKAKSGTIPGFQLWVLGAFSKKAEAELQKVGWELHPAAQRTLFPGLKKS